jgi:PAS domain S-box-containing protein
MTDRKLNTHQGSEIYPADQGLPTGSNLVATMNLGVVYQNKEGVIIFSNPAAQRILGLTEDEMLGRTSIDPRWRPIHEDGSDFPGMQHPSMESLRTGKPTRGVLMGIFRPRQEDYVWIEVDTYPEFRPGETEPFQVYSTVHDITEQRKDSRDLLERNKELTTLYTFNTLTETPDLTEAEICQQLAYHLPAGWYYSSSAVACVRLEGVDYLSPGYKKPQTTLQADVVILNEKVGLIEVGYPQTHPELDDGPFLVEEKALIQALALRLGRYLEQIRSQAELVETEARLSNVMTSMNEGLLLLDNDLRYVYINRAAEEQGRRSKDELLGRTVAECWPGIEATDFYQLEVKCNTEKVPGIIESSYIFPDGTERWFEWNIQPLPEGLLLVTTEITEKHAAKKTLEASERRFHSLIDNMLEGVQLLDSEMRYIYINHAAEVQNRRSGAEMIGRTMLDCWPGIEKTEIYRYALRALQKKEVSSGVLSYTYPGGDTRVFDVRAQPTADGFFYFTMDVTERQAAADALARSEAQYRQLASELDQKVKERTAALQDLYDSAPVGYHSQDADGLITRMNATTLRWLGYTRDEVVGKLKVTDLLSPANRLEFPSYLPQLIKNKRLQDIECEFLRKDGTIFYGLVNTSALVDDSGKFTGARVVIADFGERKKMEEALQHSRDELSQANVELALASRAKDEFLSNMSHELRTPLTGVLGLTSVLLMKNLGELNDRQQDALQKVEESGNRLLQLVNDIMDYSKLLTNSMDLEIEEVPALEIAMSALRAVTPHAEARGQKTAFKASTSDLHIRADAHRFRQLMLDLLSNASKFTAEGGQLGVEVDVSEEEGIACFTVWDTGVGIRAEDMPRLFQPFTQLDSSLSRQYNGAGLGLALVTRLVEIQGGSISLESEVGKGSRFTVCLPMASRAGAEPVRAEGRQTLLLVDDQDYTLQAYSADLTARGFKVIPTRSAHELMDLLKQEKPDAIVSDVLMPGAAASELLREIRALPDARLARTPVILMSATNLPGDREKYLQAGAYEYFKKPVPMDRLTTILNRAARDQKGNV